MKKIPSEIDPQTGQRYSLKPDLFKMFRWNRNKVDLSKFKLFTAGAFEMLTVGGLQLNKDNNSTGLKWFAILKFSDFFCQVLEARR
jgi:hypothetical protein